MEAEEWSSSGEVSDSEVCLEEMKDEEFFYDADHITKLQFRKDSLKACWKNEFGMAEILEQKGRMLTTMGIVRRGKIYCSVEETLFLAEIGALLLVDHKGESLLLSDIYKMVAEAKTGCTWEAFEVYRHLKSLGYIVGRHGVPWSLKSVKSCAPCSECDSRKDEKAKDALENDTSIVQLFDGLLIKEVEPLFDVYLPNSKFRKSSPGDPNFVVCLARGNPPTRGETEEVERKCNGIPLKFGRVEHGRVCFFSFNKVELPVLP